jgi:hypothetical protein
LEKIGRLIQQYEAQRTRQYPANTAPFFKPEAAR